MKAMQVLSVASALLLPAVFLVVPRPQPKPNKGKHHEHYFQQPALPPAKAPILAGPCCRLTPRLHVRGVLPG
jgi:hypothetical protein